MKPVKHRYHLSIYWLFLYVILLSGCASTLPDHAHIAPGTYRCDLARWDFIHPRHYYIHIPETFQKDLPYPLVLALHGSFLTALAFEQQTGLSGLADRDGFIVAYPEAIGLFGFFQHWNAGHCCAMAALLNIDDTGYLDDVIDDITSRLSIDAERIYMAGFSNGGMLTHRYAMERPHRLAAAAVVSGAISSHQPKEQSAPMPHPADRAVPILIMHGIDDTKLPYLGGPAQGDKNGRIFLPVAAAVDYWRETDHTTGDPIRQELYDGSVIRLTWLGSGPEEEVTLYTIRQWGHQWPGPYFISRCSPDCGLNGFDANDILWDFFKQKRSAGSAR